MKLSIPMGEVIFGTRNLAFPGKQILVHET